MIERHYILAQDAGANVAVANGQAVLWDPDAGGGETFDAVGVSANGLAPRSHVVCNTLIDPAWITNPIPTLEAFYANAFYEGFRITEANATDAALLTGTVEQWLPHPPRWEVVGEGQIEDVALGVMGLQRIKPIVEEEEPPGPAEWVPGTYALDAEVAHAGRVWRSLMNGNAWEPGVIGSWRDQSDPPLWVAPAGSVGLWQVDDTALYQGQTWINSHPNNAYAPDVFGWQVTT